MDASQLRELANATNAILQAIPRGSIDGPINRADLSCIRALEWADGSGDHGVTVEIAEAGPGASKLQAYVGEKLRLLGYEHIEVRTEW